MRMLIVTVSCQTANGECAYDLEIPGNVPGTVLKTQICSVLHDYTRQQFRQDTLYIQRLQRCLEPDETADQAGIWSGDVLVLK